MPSRSRAAAAAKYRLAISVADAIGRAQSTQREYRAGDAPPASPAAMSARRELGRGERVLPGLWRLRLPLPWPGVPHGNAWAIASGSGVVLVDTGYFEAGSMAQLERAMGQVNLKLEHVRLVVSTHAPSDH